MAVERSPSGSSLIDVLDRVLDKGIVIDAWVRVSLVGIDLVTIEARISSRPSTHTSNTPKQWASPRPVHVRASSVPAERTSSTGCG